MSIDGDIIMKTEKSQKSQIKQLQSIYLVIHYLQRVLHLQLEPQLNGA